MKKRIFTMFLTALFVYDWWRNGLSGKTTAVFLFYAVV